MIPTSHLDPIWAVTGTALKTVLAQIQGAGVGAILSTDEPSAPVVRREGSTAVIHIVGVMTKYGDPLFGGTSTGAVTEAVQAAARDDSIEAIVLHIDSPGGSVSGVSDLADAVYAARIENVIIAYGSDMMASAAYWIASQAHKVYANASAVVGSIGAYAVMADWSKAFDQEGVRVHVIKAGEFKGAGTPGTEITDDQLAEWQRMVSQTNELFINAMVRGRRMTAAQVQNLADGRVHIGQHAAAARLIDGVRSFESVLSDLEKVSEAETAGRLAAARVKTGSTTTSIPNRSEQMDPVTEFSKRVEVEVSRGLSRRQAVIVVGKADPQLHEMYLKATNSPAVHGLIEGRSSLAKV